MKYIEKRIIGDCTLYHGDALEILPDIEADLLVTDPPYELTSGGGTPTDQKRLSGKFNPTSYANDGNIVLCDLNWSDFMLPMFNALKDGCHAYIMANNRHLANCENAALSAGFRFHNWLVWDKGNAVPNRWYMKNCEFTGFFFKGKAKYINDCGAKQLLYVPQESYGEHPTTKPVMLMRHYIEQSSTPGNIVLDPFMGSCATGAAAVQSGRKFIGIELEKRWFDLSVQRIQQEYSLKRQKSFI